MNTSRSEIEFVGHKGGGGNIPGNTKAAIREGCKQGVDAIELDVHFTRDGHLVIYHGDIDRTVEVQGAPISDTSLSELKQSYPDRYLPETYHSEEVLLPSTCLNELNAQIPVIFDVKNQRLPPEQSDQLVERLNEFLSEVHHSNRICIASFDHQLLRDVNTSSRDVSIGLICGAHPLSFSDEIEQIDPDVLLQHWRFAGGSPVNSCSDRRIKIIPWVINQPIIARKALSAGVDGMITDDPERLQSELRSSLESC